MEDHIRRGWLPWPRSLKRSLSRKCKRQNSRCCCIPNIPKFYQTAKSSSWPLSCRAIWATLQPLKQAFLLPSDISCRKKNKNGGRAGNRLCQLLWIKRSATLQSKGSQVEERLRDQLSESICRLLLFTFNPVSASRPLNLKKYSFVVCNITRISLKNFFTRCSLLL